MEQKKTSAGLTKQKDTPLTTSPKNEKKEKEMKDENDTTSSDAQPTKDEAAKPVAKGTPQDPKTVGAKARKDEAKLEVKTSPQAPKTIPKPTAVLRLDAASKKAEQKGDGARKRIRTHVKPPLPSFRKHGRKKKAVKESNVQSCRPMKKNRKPPIPKFNSRSKSRSMLKSKTATTKMSATSHQRGVQKARVQRKPPIPRFSTKRRKVESSKRAKLSSTLQKSVDPVSSKNTVPDYHRRNRKRKPALPDFSSMRKRKRLKLQDSESLKSSRTLPETKAGKCPVNEKSSDSNGKCNITQEGAATDGKKAKPVTTSVSTNDSQMKIVESEQEKAVSFTSANDSTFTKDHGNTVTSAAKLQRLRAPKVMLDRGRTQQKTAIFPTGTGGSEQDEGLKAKGEDPIYKGVKGGVESGLEPPAGGGEKIE